MTIAGEYCMTADTLVERTTRLVILARMDGTDATSARQGFIRKRPQVPALLRKTLTYDRGKEMAEHAQLAQRLAIQIFFADPYSPWQRGTNENTNGLLEFKVEVQHLEPERRLRLESDRRGICGVYYSIPPRHTQAGAP